MRPIFAIAALVATASAGENPSLQKRQTTSNDLAMGCKEIIFIFARGSTEPGNMGIIVGPGVCSQLKATFPGKVACQGVGEVYKASMADNGRPQFTSQEAIDDAYNVIKKAVAKCPNAKITFGGYSQGGAVMHGAVAKLDAETKNHLVGGVMFGDSMNGKHNGKIQNFPPEKVHQVCHDGDGICAKRLAGITAAHLNYASKDYKDAVDFLAGQINGSGRKSKGKAAAEERKLWRWDDIVSHQVVKRRRFAK